MRDIFETIRQYHMIEPGMHVIVGVSGGADSVCLLYALCRYRGEVPFALTAVHVEHGLRGEESLGDAKFTQELCGRLGVPCRVVHAQVEQLALAEGISIEEAGRRERYRIFREIKEECSAQRVAVAHNRNDQAETLLWNLARGSGLSGLAGMRPVYGDLIRPLLFTGRDEIERILREAGLAWRTDRTNLQQEYTRNRIRLSLLPQMERELNAQAVKHIAEAAGRLREAEEFLERVTDRAEKQCIRQDGDSVCVDLAAFGEQDERIQEELLRRAVSESGGLRDFGSVHLRALLRLCGQDCGKELCLPGRLRAVRENGILRIVRSGDEDRTPLPETVGQTGGKAVQEVLVSLPDVWVQNPKEAQTCSFRAGGWRIRTEFLQNSPELLWQIIEKKYTKWISCDTINCNALMFRTRRAGDYLVVNQEGGRKKLKDYLIDLKIPRGERDRLLLLADGSHVLWVVGYRISEAAKVTEHTKRVLKVQAEEELHEGEDKDPADGAGGQ